MRRVGRLVLNALAAASLLLLLATLLLWARSYTHSPWAKAEAIVDQGGFVTYRATRVWASGGSLFVQHPFSDLSHAWLDRQGIRMARPREGFDVGESDSPETLLTMGNVSGAHGIAFGGFEFDRWDNRSITAIAGRPERATRGWQLAVPLWWLSAVFSVAPVIYVVKRNRRGSVGSDNGCPTCGYDLTGNVSGVCPECGAVAVRV